MTGTIPGMCPGVPLERPWLVVFDVDSTLIEDEVIERLAEEAGRLAEVKDITERAMAGDLDFSESLRARVAALKGLPVAVFGRVRAKLRLTAGVLEVLPVIRAQGGEIGLLSGGFHEVIDPLAEELGIDRLRANRLSIQDGRLTGTLEGPILDAEGKALALREWAEDLGIPLSRTVAIGDGANDLAMMAAAGLSIAFDAKPLVASRAQVAITERDMRQILPYLGLMAPGFV